MPNLDEIYKSSCSSDIEEYINNQQIAVSGLGFATAAIPGMHLVGMAADIAGLFKIMCDTSYGIGSINSNKKNIGRSGINENDFFRILALWSGDEDAINSVAKVSAGVVTSTVVSKVALKGTMGVLPQLAVKLVAVAVSRKMGTKLAGKALFGFIPFVGPAVSGGINLWVLNGIIDTSKLHYGME